MGARARVKNLSIERFPGSAAVLVLHHQVTAGAHWSAALDL